MHGNIKEMLPNMESYSDPLIFLERNDLAEEGGPLDEQTDKVLGDLDVLLVMQESSGAAEQWHDPQFRLAEVLRALSRHGPYRRRAASWPF
jgi:hypothetical protein